MFKIGIVENFHKDGIKLLEDHPNFTYEIIKSPDVYTADQTFSLWNFNLLCDFDANDTMTVTIDFSGGADQIDIDDQTFLSINLAC